MNFLVFQHIACAHLGVFRDFMRSDGVSWDTVELDEGESIPDLDAYDALLVMGGSMDVWQTQSYPWLLKETETIRHWVQTLNKPFLGFCLGHQLLAVALGGEVGPSKDAEIGLMEVALSESGQSSHFFAACPKNIPCLQWHFAEVSQLPAGATVLASSPRCKVNAMSWGLRGFEKAFSVQFHVEISKDTVRQWGSIPELEQVLEKSLGAGALSRLEQDAARVMPELNKLARQLYENFMRQVRAEKAS